MTSTKQCKDSSDGKCHFTVKFVSNEALLFQGDIPLDKCFFCGNPRAKYGEVKP